MSLTPARQQQWQHILDLTQQMQVLVAADDWQKITEIESARGAELAEFFKQKVSAEEAADIAEGIHSIMASDGELSALGQKAQQKILKSMGDISSGRKAVAAYDNCRK